MTYDVTAALNAARLCVFMADIYVEPVEEVAPAGRRPQELHRFLVHTSKGSRLSTPAQKRCVVEDPCVCPKRLEFTALEFTGPAVHPRAA